MTIDEFLTECETLPSIGPTMRRKLVALVRKFAQQRDDLIDVTWQPSTRHHAAAKRDYDASLLAILEGKP